MAGSLLSWLMSLGIYGFGELIEHTCRISERISMAEAHSDTAKIIRLRELHSSGLINDEEYKQSLEDL